MPSERLSEHLYLVGNSNLSHQLDCNVYLIDGSPAECILVDSGSGLSTEKILRNIEEIGFDVGLVSAVVNTHCHYRHSGGNFRLNKLLGYCEVIIHEFDAPAVEKGDLVLTGADFYGHRFEPCEVHLRAYTTDVEPMKLMGFGTRLLISAGDVEFSVIHTLGHTPGSMSMYGELDGSKVLFAGDINGALRKERGSDIESWKKTLYKLLELDIDKIYAGHEIAAKNPKEWLKKLSEKRE